MTEISRNSTVIIVTDYGLEDPGSTSSMTRISLVHNIPIGPGALLVFCPKGTWAIFLGVRLTTHLHVVRKSRIMELRIHSLIT
jgi:hypothetical protein